MNLASNALADAPLATAPLPNGGPSSAPRLGLPPAVSVGLFFVALLAWSAILWKDILRTPLLYDDYNLIYWVMVRHPAFLADFLPLENGFWRPLPLLVSRLLYLIAGTEAWPYHLFSLFLHAASACWTARLFVLLGGSLRTATMLGLLCASHSAAYDAVAHLRNVGDVAAGLAAVGALCALVGSGDSVRRRSRPTGPAILLWTCVAVAAKETGAMVAPLLGACILFGVAPWRNLPHRTRLWTAASLILVGLYFIWAVLRQMDSSLSYASGGILVLGPHIVWQLLDMVGGLLLPAAKATPVWYLQWLGGFGLILRAAVAVLLITAVGMAWRRRMRTELFLGACVLLLLLMPAFVPGPFVPRFLYPSIPFFCLLLARLGERLSSGKRLAALLTLLIFFHLPLFHHNVQTWVFNGMAFPLERLTKALEAQEDRIPSDATVCIEGHPYASEAQWWPFGQFWIRVRFPEKSWIYCTAGCPASADQACEAFTWDGQQLVRQGGTP